MEQEHTQAVADSDEAFAEWFAWAKQEVSPDPIVCMGAAQAALESTLQGADRAAAEGACRKALAGRAAVLYRQVPSRRRAYAEWYDWARREVGGDQSRLHVAAGAALRRLESGGDSLDAARSARQAVGEPEPSAQPESSTSKMDQALELASREQEGPLLEAPSKPSQMYASFGQQFFAALIDCVLLFVLLFFSFINLITAPGIFGKEGPATVIFLVFWLIMIWGYFAGLESSSLQGTLGKAAVGIVVTQSRGKKVSFWRATGNFVLRAISLGIVLAVLVFVGVLFVAGAAIIGGGGVNLNGTVVVLFLLAVLVSLAVVLLPGALTPRRQNLHNLLTGTLVVRRDYVALVAKLAERGPGQPLPPPPPTPSYTGAYGTNTPS